MGREGSRGFLRESEFQMKIIKKCEKLGISDYTAQQIR
jgi:hypothetical protein